MGTSFLDATTRHDGVCIGKPVKNTYLYRFILSIREKYRGKVIPPKDAYKGCIRGLKQGAFIGIVGDQGLVESSFTYDCLGRAAHMTTLPAILSSRSDCPLYVATIVRKYGFYEISYSGPVTSESKSIDELTLKSLKILDQKIKKNPEQYMWQHNRWKIAYPSFIPKSYRHDAILVVANKKTTNEDLESLQEQYKGAYFMLLKPLELDINISFQETYNYSDTKDCFLDHYGPKLLIDLVGIPGLKKHYMKKALFSYIAPQSISEMIKEWKNLYAG